MITADDVPGVTSERTKRCIQATITYEALAKLLDMPVDYNIMCVVDDPISGGVTLKVTTLSTKFVEEKVEAPEVYPGIGGWGER
jgi:hypothetical protein